jgi:hypothetical protein
VQPYFRGGLALLDDGICTRTQGCARDGLVLGNNEFASKKEAGVGADHRGRREGERSTEVEMGIRTANRPIPKGRTSVAPRELASYRAAAATNLRAGLGQIFGLIIFRICAVCLTWKRECA